MADVSPFTTLEIAAWSPSDWQSRLPELLAFYNEAVGAGVVKVPVFDDAAARDLVVTDPAAGDAVFLLDDGAAAPVLQVYDGSSWEAVWPASGGGGGLEIAAINLNLGATGAPNTTNIHAPFADNDASNDFPGPFGAVDAMTVAKPARRIQVQFGVGWLGGAVTVTGTGADGEPLVEAIGPGDGTTVVSDGYFASVVSATKAASAGIGAEASIGTDEQFQIVPPDGLDFDLNTLLVSCTGSSFGTASALLLDYDISAGISSLVYDGGTALDALVANINVTPAA